jgi:hypothetical protein
LGLAAAFCGRLSGSAWNAIAALIGFHLVRALFENTQAQADLFVGLGVESAADLVGVRWLLAVAVALFVAFAAIQTLRALAPPRAELSRPARAPGRWWPVPLALIVVAAALVVGIELGSRAANRAVVRPGVDSTSLPSAPLAPTATIGQ